MLPCPPTNLVGPLLGQREGQVTIVETEVYPATQASVRADCPDCNGRLAVLRVIPGRASSEYWTLRCTRCGGIHLDIVKPQPETIGA